MSYSNYPRIEVIVVPEKYPPEHAGGYASQRAAEILNTLGKGEYDSNSVQIRALSTHLFTLTFKTINGYSQTFRPQEKVALGNDDQGGDGRLPPTEPLVSRNEDRPISQIRIKATRK